MKRRLENERSAIALAVSAMSKRYAVEPIKIQTLETKYDDDAGDWYVALGWNGKRAIVKMDSVHATVTDVSEI